MVVVIFSTFGLKQFLVKSLFNYGGNHCPSTLLVDFGRNYASFRDSFVIFVGN